MKTASRCVFWTLWGWIIVPTSAVGAESWGEFDKPTRLVVDGKPIDVGAAWGHAGPTVADVDGDGLRDLVVGDFSGKFRFFRNRLSNQQPEYEAEQFLMAGDEVAEVPIYCCIGSSPLLADYDGDGRLDLVSGSYDPGECYLFRGVGERKFGSRESVVDKQGDAVLRKPEQKQKYESFGSWPALVDWDADGDLDLLVGGFDGSVFMRINEGSASSPELACNNALPMVNGKPMKLPKGHAAIVVADWDGDGLWDLLSGCESGAVYWFKNTGALGQPTFAVAETLVAPHEGNGYDEILEADAEPVPGIRSQIAAADYDDDGKLDLLVGDFCTTITPKANLTTEEQTEFAAINRELTEQTKELASQMEQLRKDFAERFPGEEAYGEEAQKAWSESYANWNSSDTHKAAQEKLNELQAKQGDYLQEPSSPGSFNKFATTHGNVWLFRRK